MILPFLASKVVRITGVSHHAQLMHAIFNRGKTDKVTFELDQRVNKANTCWKTAPEVRLRAKALR
jgi:hypothetical protein